MIRSPDYDTQRRNCSFRTHLVHVSKPATDACRRRGPPRLQRFARYNALSSRHFGRFRITEST